MPSGKKLKPVQLKKIIIKLPRGKKVGMYSAGLACVEQGALKWKGSKLNISSDDLTEIFYEEFEKAGYTVLGNPNSLFEDPSAWKSEFLIGGIVKGLEANICYPMIGFRDYESSKGGVYLKINWQVYSTLERRVVYETTTEGSYEEHEDMSEEIITLFGNAFGMATQNLLSEVEFYDLVSGKKKIYAKQSYKPTQVTGKNPFISGISSQLNDVRAAVVTIRVGMGHGSGFFISKEGHILTNAHVVGEAKTVKIILASGREILGQVVKTNKQRDVALLKVKEKSDFILPIRGSEIDVGSEVYALGSPLDEKLSSSMSRGIVSAYRYEDDQLFIQSDVNVLPGNSGGPMVDGNGNVVGLTVSGRIYNDSMAGINYFIPISSAIETLKIEMLPES